MKQISSSKVVKNFHTFLAVKYYFLLLSCLLLSWLLSNYHLTIFCSKLSDHPLEENYNMAAELYGKCIELDNSIATYVLFHYFFIAIKLDFIQLPIFEFKFLFCHKFFVLLVCEPEFGVFKKRALRIGLSGCKFRPWDRPRYWLNENI